MLFQLFRFFVLLLFFFCPFILNGEWGCGGPESDLTHDLIIVNRVNHFLNEPFPIYYNHILYGGYFSMPSARMGGEGEVGVGYASVPPYRNYNLRFQLMDWVEISGTYRVFSGIDDPILSPLGFGDKSDKGANIKFSIIHPEDTNFILPGIAFGFEDFTGTKGFESRYIVLTQIVPQWNLECSLGYGQKRIRGVFGGVTWLPFRCIENDYLKHLALVAEYDATAYKSPKREPHPEGRKQKSPINYGIKYRLWKYFDFSACYLRGEEFAYSISSFYNFGMTKGFFPKINDPLPYTAPKNIQPLGPLRPTDVLVQDLIFPFSDQGFELQDIWLSYDRCGKKNLRLNVYNYTYRYEDQVRNRLNDLLSNLIPKDISEVVVVLVNETWPVQEYRFSMDFLRMFGERQLCSYEMSVLTPMKEADKLHYGQNWQLFKYNPEALVVGLYPKTYTAFGSASGKFKYLLGVHLGLSGVVWNDWFYSVVLGYTLTSNLWNVRAVDRLNPSQIINVRTDTVNYFKSEKFTVDQAYIQKWWNLGLGWYTTAALGLFEEAYGGIAGEFLYYPVDSSWAFGVEGAYLRKRQYDGIGFTNKVRKLEGYRPTYLKYHGSQYFVDLYYNFPNLDVDLHFKAGKFLAHDWGVRSEVSRYYPSGMRLYFWYTYTDARDYVNGKRYQDHGAGISLPLDIFYTYSSRGFCGYGMSAWLRDVGAISSTGVPLYYQIRSNRERSISPIMRSHW